MSLPDKIQNFEKIAGAILTLLYENFPFAVGLTPYAIARVITGSEDVSTVTLQSGVPFAPFVNAAADWLLDEGFIHRRPHHSGRERESLQRGYFHPWDGAVLSSKGYAALYQAALMIMHWPSREGRWT